jgi:hypothetical protein
MNHGGIIYVFGCICFSLNIFSGVNSWRRKYGSVPVMPQRDAGRVLPPGRQIIAFKGQPAEDCPGVRGRVPMHPLDSKSAF